MDRGYYIKNEKWDKAKAVEDKIDDKLSNDKEFVNKLQRPCSAFVTWDSEEALRRAEMYNEGDVINEPFLGQ